MKAQHIRPKVQNGPIARRSSSRAALIIKSAKAAKRSKAAAGSSAAAEARESDSRVFWMMVLAGIVLTAGFLLGLRSRINAHQLNQAEEKLKDELDRHASQEKFLSIEQQRARSPREIERARKEAGLLQLKLDRENALPVPPPKPAAASANAAANVKEVNQLKAGLTKAGAKTPTGRVAAASAAPPAKDRQPTSVKMKKDVALKFAAAKPAAGKPLKPLAHLPAKKAVEKKPAARAGSQPLKPKSENTRPRRVSTASGSERGFLGPVS